MPLDFSAESNSTPDILDPARVKSLKLEFSKAADYNRINRLFDPAVKSRIDPNNYVVKRLESVFRPAVANGQAAILSDQDGNVSALTVAYRLHNSETPAPGARHDYTELGTSLAVLQGYRSAQLVIAALALREWWNNPPARGIVADIKTSNGASVKAYKTNLGWEEITDKAVDLEIDITSDRTLVEEKDKAAPRKLQFPDEPTGTSWYSCNDKALATQAQVLLNFMMLGGLLSSQKQHIIPVDFTALEEEGLTKARLKLLAAGVTSRERLNQATGPIYEP